MNVVFSILIQIPKDIQNSMPDVFEFVKQQQIIIGGLLNIHPDEVLFDQYAVAKTTMNWKGE